VCGRGAGGAVAEGEREEAATAIRAGRCTRRGPGSRAQAISRPRVPPLPLRGAHVCSSRVVCAPFVQVEKCKASAELRGKARGAAGAAGSPAARAKPGAGGPGSSGGRVAGYPVAYVGNVAFEVGAPELEALFGGAGAPPSRVRLHTDKASGRSKGYAHVHFASDDAVDRCGGGGGVGG
jgi:hypothetical protein